MLRYIHLWGNTFIGGYGLMIALGVVIGVGLGYLVMRRRGYDADDFLLLSAYGGLGAMIGAKALFLWTVRDYIDPPRLLDPTYELGALAPAGFVFLGGFCCGTVLVAIMSQVHGISLSTILQNGLFALPLAHGFGRIGCFLGGCCYGIPYEGPFAVTFPEDIIPGSVPRFPVQLLSALLLFILAAVLYLVSRTRHKAIVPWLYVSLDCIGRFVVEFLRGDSIRGIYWGLSLSQWISLAIGLGCAVFLIWRHLLPGSQAQGESRA